MKTTKRNFLVNVSGVPRTWRSFSGAGATAEYTRDYSGGADVATLLSGPAEHEDIELVRTYEPDQDPAWLDQVKKQVGRSWFTITKQATDQNWTKVGKPVTYPNCLLIGVKEPDTDAASSDSSEVTLTFATPGPA